MSFARQMGKAKIVEEHIAPEIPDNVKTIDDLQQHIEIEYERKRRKPRVEDTHTRITVLLDSKLNNRFNAICATKEKGFKTLTVNRLIAAFLRDYEDTMPM